MNFTFTRYRKNSAKLTDPCTLRRVYPVAPRGRHEERLVGRPCVDYSASLNTINAAKIKRVPISQGHFLTITLAFQSLVLVRPQIKTSLQFSGQILEDLGLVDVHDANGAGGEIQLGHLHHADVQVVICGEMQAFVFQV